jgi:prepilin-type N-terminal cleavage/methylation domain-containing protein
MTGNTHPYEAGYTLVELLVVMLLLSLITLAIDGGLRFGTRVWESTEERISQADHSVEGHRLLRQLLSSALPQRKGEYVVFEGTPFGLTFLALSPRVLRAGAPVRVTLSVAEAASKVDLKIAIREQQGADLHTAKIATEAASLRFAYLDAAETVPIWLDRWHDRNRLPDAVRIVGEDMTSRGKWPELIVRLPVAQIPGCTFDPISLVCRGA